MLSAFSATDGGFSNQFPAFEGGFAPWDLSEIFPSTPSPGPVVSSSGSETEPAQNPETNQNPVQYCSATEEPTQNPVQSNSSSDNNTNRAVIDERKRRRMISNRESARRSRMRKQKHLENLRNQVSRLRIENRELSSRLRSFLYYVHRVRSENEQLRSEHAVLRQKLSEIGDFLVIRQFQEQYSSSSSWLCNTTMT